MKDRFWEQKSILDFTKEEWELVCDGCGSCCYKKFIKKHRRNKKLFYTKIACDLLNLKTGLCSMYQNRFKLNIDCTKLTKKNIKDVVYWLPDTCAYKLLFEKKPLYDWHPLIAKNRQAMMRANILIEKGIHEKDMIDWVDFIIDEKPV